MAMTMPRGPVTMALAGLTLLCWLGATVLGWSQAIPLFGGFIPARLSGIVDVAGAVPVWLTPLSATLVHGSIIHVGFNMMMLVFCGRYVEGALGGPMLALLYLLAAYGAAFAQYAIDPQSLVPTIGASGAVSGVVGAYALLYGRRKAGALGPIPAQAVHLLWLAAAWVGIQAMIELASYGSPQKIAVAAHVGGFIVGLLLAHPMLLWRYRRA